MMEGGGFWAAAVAAAVLIGLAKGGLQVVGMLAVPVLALVIHPLAAAGLLLPVFVVSDAFGLLVYRRRFDRRVLALMIPPALVGIALGWATASLVSERLITGLIGLIGFVFAVAMILRPGVDGPPRRPRAGPAWLWGTLTGFTSFVSHSGAPPWQVYVLPLRLDKLSYAGTSTVMFAAVNAVKLIPYHALGQLAPQNLSIAAVLALPAVAGVFAGYGLVRVLPQAAFYRLVTAALLVVSLKLLWDAAL